MQFKIDPHLGNIAQFWIPTITANSSHIIVHSSAVCTSVLSYDVGHMGSFLQHFLVSEGAIPPGRREDGKRKCFVRPLNNAVNETAWG